MQQKGFWGRLFILLSAMLAGIVLTYVFTILGTVVFVGVSITGAMQCMTTSLATMRWMQVLQDALVFIMPALMVCLYSRRPADSFLLISRGRGSLGANLAVSCIAMIASLPLINLLVDWNESIRLPYWLASFENWVRSMETVAQQTTEMFLSGTSLIDLIMNILLVALMAALSEEILFRGALMRMLGEAFRSGQDGTNEIPNKAMHAAIWVSAALFSAFHLQFYGFFPRMLMGAWFGYMLWWTGSLWVPMAAHFTNNAVAVFFTFAAHKGWVADSFAEELGTGSQMWMSIISVAVLVLSALYYRKVSKA